MPAQISGRISHSARRTRGVSPLKPGSMSSTAARYHVPPLKFAPIQQTYPDRRSALKLCAPVSGDPHIPRTFRHVNPR
ncbi:hypothetical protein VTN02DRAFT_963 [Thermoascus thermophilus]